MYWPIHTSFSENISLSKFRSSLTVSLDIAAGAAALVVADVHRPYEESVKEGGAEGRLPLILI